MKTYMAKAEGLERKWYVIDAEGNKLDQKKYYRHTGHPGGLKEVGYRDLMANKPEFAFTKAVKGMLPKNSLGRSMLKKLKVYAGPEHKHEAQQPQKLDI